MLREESPVFIPSGGDKGKYSNYFMRIDVLILKSS